jgi:hypothetical protein
MLSRTIKISLGVLLILFAMVQYNDPDPGLWILFYGIGAFFCISSAFYRTQYSDLAMYVYIAICIVFAIINWPEVWMGFDQDAVLPNPNVEQARESCGLLISALFVAVCRFIK